MGSDIERLNFRRSSAKPHSRPAPQREGRETEASLASPGHPAVGHRGVDSGRPQDSTFEIHNGTVS